MQLLSTCDNVCQDLETIGNFWRLVAIFGYFCHLFIPVGNILRLLTSCHIVNYTSCHSVLLPSCQSGSLSICQLVNFAACELLSLWSFQLASACKLVLHIRSMISFGGFLAECLPCCDIVEWDMSHHNGGKVLYFNRHIILECGKDMAYRPNEGEIPESGPTKSLCWKLLVIWVFLIMGLPFYHICAFQWVDTSVIK